MKRICLNRKAFLLCGLIFTVTTGIAQTNPYMGGPVTLVKAPNGAIANKKLLDGIEKVAYLKPTIEQPAEDRKSVV